MTSSTAPAHDRGSATVATVLWALLQFMGRGGVGSVGPSCQSWAAATAAASACIPFPLFAFESLKCSVAAAARETTTQERCVGPFATGWEVPPVVGVSVPTVRERTSTAPAARDPPSPNQAAHSKTWTLRMPPCSAPVGFVSAGVDEASMQVEEIVAAASATVEVSGSASKLTAAANATSNNAVPGTSALLLTLQTKSISF